ncbi:gliding motility-associated C-terminal domain-containing protein, partial [uncultured Lacinutrix sp.]|uniref:gliding motility-associated C-terminal domain-containing protein n=1 Tax=uncultured Lacinutrix sp. TaxID=574032 RepID=UPI002639C941
NCGAGGAITVTYTVADDCGNTTQLTATLTLEDTTGPDLTNCTVVDETIECGGTDNENIAIAWDAANIATLQNCGTDACDVDPTNVVTSNYDFNNLVSNCGAGGAITVTYTVADDCGNTTQLTATLTLEDTTGPDLTICTDVTNTTIECNGTDNATIASTWNADNMTTLSTCPGDDCDLDSIYTVTSDFDFNNLVSTCGLGGTIIVNYTVTDDCGNTATTTATLTLEDSTGPDLSNCNVTNTTIECNGSENETLANEWNANNIETLTSCGVDACDADTTNTVTSNYSFVNLNSNCGAGGTIEVTYTVADDCGNESISIATLTIEDTTAPTLLTNLEPESYVICSEIPEPPTLEFSDECSNIEVTIDFNETNNNAGDGEDYEIVWEWIVSDSCNNSNVYTHTVNVISEDFVTDLDGEHCNNDGTIDLFEYLTEGIDTSGTWTVEQGDVVLDTDGTFDPIDLELGDYIFTYSMASDDCRATIRVTLNIHDKCIVQPCGVEGLVISKAVTPNGDGHNDFFFIQGDQKCGFIIDLQIFNRYGGIIYDVKDYKNDWSGQAIKQSLGTADKLPNGTYYYVIILRNSGLDPITGPLFLGTK